MFAYLQKKETNWTTSWWSWIEGVMTNKKTLSLLMLGLLATSGNGLPLGRQEKRSNREEDSAIPPDDIGNGALNKKVLYIAGTPVDLPMPFDARQQAADAIGLRNLEELSESEEFETYLAELVGEDQVQKEQEEYNEEGFSETEQAEENEDLAELVSEDQVQEKEPSEVKQAEKDKDEVGKLESKACRWNNKLSAGR